MYQKIYQLWKEIGLDGFWGDFFDVRFYLIFLLRGRKRENIIDIGCGSGVISYFVNSSLKIGIDLSNEALQNAKKLNPKMELIQASMYNLPIKHKSIKTVLSAHVIQALPEDMRIKACNEIKNITSKDGEIYMTCANLMSEHFQEKIKNIKSINFNPHELIKIFSEGYNVDLKGYGPYSKNIMFLLKFIYKIPESVIEILKIEELIQSKLLLKKKIHRGKGCILICKKRVD